MTPSIRLTAPVLGTPDPRSLARFYQRLLGWPLRDDEPDWATLRPADGSTGLSFQLEGDHVPPVWPPQPGTQQMRCTSISRSTTSIPPDIRSACPCADNPVAGARSTA